MAHAAVVDPAVELGGVLELLASLPADGQIRTVQVGQRAEIAPEFFELGDRINVLLTVSRASLDILDRDVGWHSGRHRGTAAARVGQVPWTPYSTQIQ